ncbi:MAG: hypothetical protein NVSMB51_08710 [Solirubrobacteraceae bacterium]
MARRRRERLRTPQADYPGPDGSLLTLRGALSPGTRRKYGELAGSATREDAWQRQVEFLFERLAVRWVIHDVPTEGDKLLLMRLRAATQEERTFVREALRRHCGEYFPDLQAP